MQGPKPVKLERLSAALAPHRILLRLPAMDCFQAIDLLFDALKPDYAPAPQVWAEAKEATAEMERRLSCALPGGLALLQPLGNAGAPGQDWLAAVACSQDGILFQDRDPSWPPVRMAVLTLNPAGGGPAYLRRIFSINRIWSHPSFLSLAEADDAEQFLAGLKRIEEAVE